MIEITFFQNQEQAFTGFDCSGHAEYADPGSDIVCAAVSALVINCVNSIEALTDAQFSAETPGEGEISFRLQDVSSAYAQLLLQSLALGLEEMEGNYEDFIDVIVTIPE